MMSFRRPPDLVSLPPTRFWTNTSRRLGVPSAWPVSPALSRPVPASVTGSSEATAISPSLRKLRISAPHLSRLRNIPTEEIVSGHLTAAPVGSRLHEDY